MTRITRIQTVCFLLAGGSATIPAWSRAGNGAGLGTITFEPLNASSVPTLGGAMMIFLALLLAFIAFRSMRARNGRGSAGMLLVGALAAGSLASGLGGFNLLRDAVAGGSMTTPIEDANGQTFELKYGRNDFQNESGVIQRVARIMLTDEGERDCTNAAGLAEPQVALIQECREDLQLDEGESCRIECED